MFEIKDKKLIYTLNIPPRENRNDGRKWSLVNGLFIYEFQHTAYVYRRPITRMYDT